MNVRTVILSNSIQAQDPSSLLRATVEYVPLDSTTGLSVQGARLVLLTLPPNYREWRQAIKAAVVADAALHDWAVTKVIWTTPDFISEHP
jgi:hypothetical protein